MIGFSKVMGIKEQEPVITLLWETKGRKRKRYRIKSLKLYLHERHLEQLNKTTKMKAELLLNQIYSIYKLGRIRGEMDLEILINGFMRERNPAMVFNSTKHFTYTHTAEHPSIIKTNLDADGYVLVNDKYFKRKFNKLRKNLMKETINASQDEVSDE